ncbi:PAS domain S-box-containing protein [Sphingomonas palmae]|uniref:PAS domain S-box-containing protein n=2 Tax=Sphingomonas palmae TaxID=1855283 RepID=A0A1H7PJR4_9SPHN|nr:PAS domain S-box-containing protein [Sphingomonas palmae]
MRLACAIATGAGEMMDQRDNWHLTDMVEHESGRGDPFAAAVRATRMPMIITDPRQDDNPIVFCNEAFQTLSGYDRSEIIGTNCRFLQGPDTDREKVAEVRAAIEAGTDVAVDLLNYRKDGSTFWNALYVSPVRNRDGEIEFFFASQMDVSDRVEAQERIARQKAEVEREVEARTADLKAALDDKTLLLHEVDHRVKNNLTMIGSLLRLQARGISDEDILARLNSMLERIDALASVHRRLYQSDDVTRFDAGAFALNLATDVVGASGRTEIDVKSDVAAIDISSTNASALGLVLNEIVTNAVKHGFADGRGGTLSVHAYADGDTGVIAIADDGPGFDAANTPEDGLGRVLIRRLSRQIGAQVDWSSAEPGARVTIRFPLDQGHVGAVA